MDKIRSGLLLSDEQIKDINAAMALAGENQTSFAKSNNVSYWRVNRMLSQREIVTASYARLFNRYIKKEFSKRLGAVA
jgi:hypothetical protein